MKGMTEILKKAREPAKPFRVTDGDGFRLKDIDPGDTLDLTSEDKPRAQEALAIDVQALSILQDMPYADALAFLNLNYPEVGEEKLKELAAVKEVLMKT